MSETRQQRRARERRESKDATRPGPRTPPAAAGKRDLAIAIELNRTFFDDPDETYVSWYAQWGVRDDSTATEDTSEDLAELVAAIVADLTRPGGFADRHHLQLEWTVEGDPPEGMTIEQEIAELGVRLPSEVVPA